MSGILQAENQGADPCTATASEGIPKATPPTTTPPAGLDPFSAQVHALGAAVSLAQASLVDSLALIDALRASGHRGDVVGLAIAREICPLIDRVDAFAAYVQGRLHPLITVNPVVGVFRS